MFKIKYVRKFRCQGRNKFLSFCASSAGDGYDDNNILEEVIAPTSKKKSSETCSKY